MPGEPDPDATTPFEPIPEVVLEPWTAPAAPSPPSKASFLRRYRLELALVLGALLAAGLVAVIWWRLA